MKKENTNSVCVLCQFYEPNSGCCTRKHEPNEVTSTNECPDYIINECPDYIIRDTIIMFGG